MDLIRIIIEVEAEMAIRGVVAEDLIILALILDLIMVSPLVNPLEMQLLPLNFLVFNHNLSSKWFSFISVSRSISNFKTYLSNLWQEWSHCLGLLSSHEFCLSRQTCSSQVSIYGRLTPSHCFRLDNILRVPDLASNLLYVHKLCLQNNVFCYFDANQFLIVNFPMGKVLYQGLSKDGVYPIPFSSQLSADSDISSSFAFKSSVKALVSNEAMLWHQRRGHPCSKLLHSTLSSFNNNVKIFVHDDICSQCKPCISAKMHKLPFPKHIMSRTSPLQQWCLGPCSCYFYSWL